MSDLGHRWRQRLLRVGYLLRREREQPQPVPIEYAGKWVAWSPDGMRILLAGDTLREVREEAMRRGYADAIFEGIPRRGALHHHEAGA